MYNCAGRISSLRCDFPETRAGSDIEWRLKRAVVSLDFKFELIDPYNVAGLIALAQEQRGVFFRFGQTAPGIFKVRFTSLLFLKMLGVDNFAKGTPHLTSPFGGRSILLRCRDSASIFRRPA